MRRRIGIIGILLLSVLSLSAQTIMQHHDKPFDVSFRVGFNSTMPIIHRLQMDGIDLTNTEIHYKVGYLAAMTFSVNINRFTLQPSVSWYHKEAEIEFTGTPREEISSNNAVYDENLQVYNLQLESQSVEVPILIGYQLVKEDPYGLSLKFGAKGIYRYKTNNHCTGSSLQITHEKDNSPYSLHFVSAINMTIGRLFLDFSYEFGLHNTRSDFTYLDPTTSESGTLMLERRNNVLSFSLGAVF